MIGRALQEGVKQKPVNVYVYEESFLTKTLRRGQSWNSG
jgi:hypothetical protein